MQVRDWSARRGKCAVVAWKKPDSGDRLFDARDVRRDVVPTRARIARGMMGFPGFRSPLDFPPDTPSESVPCTERGLVRRKTRAAVRLLDMNKNRTTVALFPLLF